MPAIALVGEDEFLLQTRAAVLRGVGAEIVCSDSDSALALVQDRVFDLVILCHSVPEELGEKIRRMALQRSARTQFLQICATREWEPPDAADGVTISSADPERLIRRTIELLRAAGSSGRPNT